MEAFATVNDVSSLFRALTAEETTMASALLPAISDELRQGAINRGRDLDKMIESGTLLESVVKTVVVDIVARALLTSKTLEPMTQVTESALGYSFSGTPANQYNKVYFIYNKDYERLGLTRQRVGGVDYYGFD